MKLKQADDYEAMTAWPVDVPLAFESRNKAWLTPELLEFLPARGVVLALPDQAWMPSPLSVLESTDAVTGAFGYVRCSAIADELTKTLDKTVIDRRDQIDADARAIRRLSERTPVLAFVNNPFAGYAPATGEALKAAIVAS